MKYLIFDTNIWIFLANSQNTKDGKYHEDIHFRLLSRLKELVQEDKIQILTNDIIKDEWNRNKIRTQEGIKKLTDKRNTNLNIIKEVRASLEEADQQLLDIISKKYQDQIEKQIERNRAHIEEVEDFFLRFTTKIPVSDAVKLKCTEIALAKKLPSKEIRAIVWLMH